VFAGEAIRRVEREGANAISVLDDEELARFVPIDGVEVPEGSAYLLVDVDTWLGSASCAARVGL
jgi:hypothetical protein